MTWGVLRKEVIIDKKIQEGEGMERRARKWKAKP